MQLLIVDTVQIQPYIFGSNRLRENVGASHLVASATENWARQAVHEAVPGRHNIVDVDKGVLLPSEDETGHIEKNADLDAEVLYAGGGNFVVLFREPEDGRSFITHLSQRALEQAPNLQLVIAQKSFDWGESLSDKMKSIFQELVEQAGDRAWPAPLLGLGVTTMCRSTGLPAVGVTDAIDNDPDSRYAASAEVLAKLKVVLQAKDRLRDQLPIDKPADKSDLYDYPDDLDDLARTMGEFSHVAVVHADGNGMGNRVRNIGKDHTTPEQNRGYITTLRAFSNGVNEAAQIALRSTLDKLVTCIRRDDNGRTVIVHSNKVSRTLAEIELASRKDGGYYLPFRPIVFGGDDVTFVCDGRLGLSLAIEYLRAFERETNGRNLPGGEGKITACAGIAIVKSHYPFARAYELAHALCDSAKKYRHHLKDEGSYLDWHFALGGLAGSIEEIRRREYRAKTGCLTLRPVALGENTKTNYRAWPVVESGINAFQDVTSEEEQWAGRRNKIKALRDALREGPDAVESFRWKFNEHKPLPNTGPSSPEDWREKGWRIGEDNYCLYFDAIELADWYVPLKK